MFQSELIMMKKTNKKPVKRNTRSHFSRALALVPVLQLKILLHNKRKFLFAGRCEHLCSLLQEIWSPSCWSLWCQTMGASSSRQSSQKSLKLREDKRNTQGKAKTKSAGLGQNKHSPKQESPNGTFHFYSDPPLWMRRFLQVKFWGKIASEGSKVKERTIEIPS